MTPDRRAGHGVAREGQVAGHTRADRCVVEEEVAALQIEVDIAGDGCARRGDCEIEAALVVREEIRFERERRVGGLRDRGR